MFYQNCVFVNSCPDQEAWELPSDGRREFVEVIPTTTYIEDCDQYLHDLYAQAARDIPRMSIKFNNRIAVNTIQDLQRHVALDQLHFILVTCTQTLWGYPYISVSANSGLIVCERHPPSRCKINLISAWCDTAQAHRVKRVKAVKRMRAAASPELLDTPSALDIQWKLDIDHDSVCIHTYLRH